MRFRSPEIRRRLTRVDEASCHPGPLPPLVAHLIYRLASGGLENGLVNLVNHMPADRFRHAILCITDHTDFRERIRRDDVSIHCLNKKPGHDPAYYWRLWKTLRELRPQVLHTRTFAALDAQILGRMAGIPGRVHGEHGRDVGDWENEPRRRRVFRAGADRFVDHYVGVSDDIASCLVRSMGIPESRVTRIYNGVDRDTFRPREGTRPAVYPPSFQDENVIVIGWVGTMRAVKDPLALARAFVALQSSGWEHHRRMRLVMVGDGPLKQACEDLLREGGAYERAWLPGTRNDVPELLRGMDLFALPSLAEGTSNAILESMASGVPVIATNVGGNLELVTKDTGLLVEPQSSEGLAAAVRSYLDNPEQLRHHSKHARRRSLDFGLDEMIGSYMRVYDDVLRL